MVFDKSAPSKDASVSGGESFDVEPIEDVGYAFSKGTGVHTFEPPVASIQQKRTYKGGGRNRVVVFDKPGPLGAVLRNMTEHVR